MPRGAVLIERVLYDPPLGVPDPGGEWLTLRNMTTATIAMRGWRLRDSHAETPLPPIDLPPRAAALVAAQEVVEPPALDQVLTVRLDGRIGNGLRNAGDSLTLLDQTGSVVDALSWGDDRSVLDPPLARVAAGTPLVRVDLSQGGESPASSEADDAGPARGAGASTVGTATVSGETAAVENGAPTGAESLESALSTSTTLVVSEIAPRAGWVELYNRGSVAVNLENWSLSESGGAATMKLSPDLSVAPHGFVVIHTPTLHLSESTRKLLLLAPGGELADLVETGPTEGNTGWSRYPVHGGVWTKNTPLTPGNFNLPVVEDVTTSPPVSAKVETPAEASAVAVASSGPSPWRYLVLAPLLAALVALWGFFNRRPAIDGP
ncbi:MAG TPA: lamin tail domain-containing protein [Herpetosiphonaceae bacterium]|nr:lamin tail domain-containing protein [Herpetosiphonaceae bacterium]